MTIHDEELNRKQTDDEEGEGGSTGQSGAIEFRFDDPTSGPLRDDLLSPSEIKRLLAVHGDLNKFYVEKQKQKIQAYKALREGKTKGYQLGGGGSGGLRHPLLAKLKGKRDSQVSPDPAINDAETNAELKEQLENRLENRLQNTPKFNPKPQRPW